MIKLQEKSQNKASLASLHDSVSRIASLPATREFRRSQYEAFTRQVPVLYVLLFINTAAVAFTHRHVAPRWLAIVVPVVLCLLCAGRMVSWLAARKHFPTDEQIVRRLRVVPWAAAVIGVAFTAWALELWRYGDTWLRCQLMFYVTISAIACIFCLMQVRAAALLMAAVVYLPFAVWFFIAPGNNEVTMAIAANMLVVLVVLVYFLFGYHKDFSTLVESQLRLVAKQEEAERLSAENFRLANLDGLTLLPNRQRFYADLARLLSGADPARRTFAVGMLEIEGFRSVNELHGQEFGDRVMEEIGHRLMAFASTNMTLARVGDERFGILISGNVDDAVLIDVGTALCAALRRTYALPGGNAILTASVGFAAWPDGGQTATTLSEHAEYALLHAKSLGPGKVATFTKDQETLIKRVNQIDQGLRLADLECEVRVHFQPIVDVSKNEIVAFEALARWHSPTLGVVDPGEFFSVAERSTIVHTLTHVLLRKALAVAAGWPPQIHLSFNLSARDLASTEAIRSIMRIVEDSGVAPTRLTFEVTETALIRDMRGASGRLALLRELGAQIALDDFGTGYSSLNYLHRLPVDRIKIDRSFVADITRIRKARAVVKSILDLCESLRMTCTVEGVETAEQVRALRELGCTHMQGYFFGKPVQPEDVPEAFFSSGPLAI